MTEQNPKPPARPRRLGRGLAALVDQASSAVRESQAAVAGGPSAPPARPERAHAAEVPSPVAIDGTAAPETDGSFIWLLIGSVSMSPYQPRSAMDEEALGELADSIRRSGVIQPVVVRPSGDGYELIAGERRWRAAARAGLEKVPAIVRRVDDRTAAEWALVENLQRADLNPVERARAFQRLADEFGLTHAEIAESAGVKRPTVANTIRLLDLDDDLLGLVASGALSAGHAKVLLSVADTSRRRELGERCASGGWSVRELEQRANEAPKSPVSSQHSSNANHTARVTAVRDLEWRMGERLGTRVAIRTNADGSKGKLTIEFYSLDHFDDLARRLGMDAERG